MDSSEYRVVIDELTDKDVGVIKIDGGKWKGAHWIVDHDGDERRAYKYRQIDAASYGNAIAFETHPVLKVRYKPIQYFISEHDSKFWVAGVGGCIAVIATSLILGTVIKFSDLAPILSDSIWFQIGYWSMLFLTLGGFLGVLISAIAEAHVKNYQTKKDRKVTDWLNFKKEGAGD